MDSVSLLSPSLDFNKEKDHNGGLFFDSSLLQKQAKIPKQFIWPQTERPNALPEELKTPIINLEEFFRGDEVSTQHVVELIRDACSAHGFFQVINHGVDISVRQAIFELVDRFFKLPLDRKLRARRRPGCTWGYTGAHTDRFSSRLPWKETLSFVYNDGGDEELLSMLGKDFEEIGKVYKTYCKSMFELALSIMEILAMSQGLTRERYREFFEDGSCIVRCNYYPPCQEPELALGTGPHCDPTALTILQQDQVRGLEVFAEGKWQSVSPVRDALVINIGDTFMALCNGRYRSCLHRAVVNPHRERKSLAFFLCPKGDRIVKPPLDLSFDSDSGLMERKYPDFKWADLLEFTQRCYRADTRTLQSFSDWIQSKERMSHKLEGK
ncbi:uncharacterized protein A4U43_C02F6590 [Asparagus officinalis]|uniref:Fe2OG dioxygenase domain-containing protein n=1 Tax=Asparagus officinalis TaxID=4686 RepID=A0A5P1FH97_ASPOF|nr:gibberellin 20 oxidase 2-like [Asparagus officinalis]ONK77444.1 uncharacterized protein A4U43_C02F6590 [Asparagus officinalis]